MAQTHQFYGRFVADRESDASLNGEGRVPEINELSFSTPTPRDPIRTFLRKGGKASSRLLLFRILRINLGEPRLCFVFVEVASPSRFRRPRYLSVELRTWCNRF